MATRLVRSNYPNAEIADQVAKRAVVLAVDDDEDNLTLLIYTLEPLDCDIVGKTSGQAALLFAQETQPDLILLDVLLPDIHGIDLVRCLKQDNRTRHIPIIALTGLASSEDRAALLEEGCSHYLSKPYMLDELEAIVQHYLVRPDIPSPLVS